MGKRQCHLIQTEMFPRLQVRCQMVRYVKVLNGVKVLCHKCKNYKFVKMTDQQYNKWTGPNSDLVQHIFPTTSAEDRELLISGTCGPCWDEMFKEEE